jgi:hypothetical protein
MALARQRRGPAPTASCSRLLLRLWRCLLPRGGFGARCLLLPLLLLCGGWCQ